MSIEDAITASLAGVPGRDGGSDGVEDTSGEAVETTSDADEGLGATEEADASTEALEGSGDGSDVGDADADGEDASKVVAGDADVDEFGLSAKDKTGRTNRIPYPRVQKIVENAQAKLYKSITGEEVPRDDQGRPDFTAAATNLKSTIEEYRGGIEERDAKLTQISTVEAIMMDDPERFLEMLPHLNPRYAELIGGGQHTQGAIDTSDMPMPDLDLGNGQKTYSPEGLQARLEWERKQASAMAAKAAEEAVAKKLSPLEKRQRAEFELSQARQAISTKLTHMRTNWEGFTDHEDAILAVMREDRETQAKRGKAPSLSVEEAYFKVVFPKLKADRNKMRAELLEEQKKIKTSTSTNVAQPAKKAVGQKSGDPVADAIKASISGLKR